MTIVRGVRVHPTIVGRLTGLLSHAPGANLSSGWRSVERNAAVGGVRRSRHLAGVAVDIVGPRADLETVLREAPRHGAVEVIFEGDHVHVAWRRPDS